MYISPISIYFHYIQFLIDLVIIYLVDNQLLYSNANKNMHMLIKVNIRHKNVKGVKKNKMTISEVN